MARRHTFRIVNIPGSCTLSDVEQVIEELLDPEEGKLEIINPTLIPSPSTPCSEAEKKRGIKPKVAMLFSVAEPLPKFLAKLRNGKDETAEFELKDEVAEIDANFMGFTQLYYPALDVSISAE